MVGAGRGNLGANLAVLLLRRLSQIYKRRVTAENCAPPDADYTPFDKSSADNHSATTAAPRHPNAECERREQILTGIEDLPVARQAPCPSTAEGEAAPIQIDGEWYQPKAQTIEEAEQNPDNTRPLEVLIPGIAARNLLTLLCGREKLGKSTFMAYAVAALSQGRTLWGQSVQADALPVGRHGGRLLSGVLYGIKPTDPATLIMVPLLLAAVALVASYLPARRAARVDPTRTLRDE